MNEETRLVDDPQVLELIDLGEMDYVSALELQRVRHRDLIAGNCASALLLCQHPAVITRGKSARSDSLLSTREVLASEQIQLHEVDRGGDITFHGPGQFIAYPIIKLTDFRTDVGWYMRQLEEVVIRSLSELQVDSQRISGRTGVWTGPEVKIASIGVRISRWCTMHGLAVNVLRSSETGFRHLIPCGLTGVAVTSIEQELSGPCSMDQFRQVFIRQFEHIFSVLLRATKG